VGLASRIFNEKLKCIVTARFILFRGADNRNRVPANISDLRSSVRTFALNNHMVASYTVTLLFVIRYRLFDSLRQLTYTGFSLHGYQRSQSNYPCRIDV
jgi:hypothetical protein